MELTPLAHILPSWSTYGREHPSTETGLREDHLRLGGATAPEGITRFAARYFYPPSRPWVRRVNRRGRVPGSLRYFSRLGTTSEVADHDLDVVVGSIECAKARDALWRSEAFKAAAGEESGASDLSGVGIRE